MPDMIEVRYHSRGGQGAKTLSQMLAEAVVAADKFAQGNPDYGPERAGAPMRAFNRFSDGPIRLHCAVDYPYFVVVLDDTLIDVIDILAGISDNGILLVNTDKSPKKIIAKLNISKNSTIKVYAINASQIGLDEIGRPIPNTVLAGAFIKISNIISLKALLSEIEEKFSKKLTKKMTNDNIKAAQRGHDEVMVIN